MSKEPMTPAERLLAKMKLPTLAQLEALDDDDMTGTRFWPLDAVRIRDLREYLMAVQASESPICSFWTTGGPQCGRCYRCRH